MSVTTIQLKLDIKNHSKKAIPTVWPCKAWKLTRKSIAELHSPLNGDYADFDICGVYLLLAPDAVYVGEAEQVISRFKQHHSKPPLDWSTAIAFVSKEESFEKSHIKYLEHEIFQRLKKIGRYKIANTSTPRRSHVSDEDTMRTYLDNIINLADVLGFDGLIETAAEEEAISVSLYKKSENAEIANKKEKEPSLSEDGEFPFKVGKVMAYAFRAALSRGILTKDIDFLMSSDASRLFKTRGNTVIALGDKPKKDKKGIQRFSTTPVVCDDTTYWLTTQVYKEGLPAILTYLSAHGMSRDEVIDLCQKGELTNLSPKEKEEKKETFLDYLKRTMCKNSASSYSSSFRALEKKLLECKIITKPLSVDISIDTLDAVREYVSSNSDFLAYNKVHHYSRSAAWVKFEKYLEGIK